jgi:hypothetical protein
MEEAQANYTLTNNCNKLPLSPRYLIFLLLLLLISLKSLSQDTQQDYEEIGMQVNIQTVGNIDAAGMINGRKAYLSINELFTYLKIKNVPTPSFDSVSGFFLSTKAQYVIDKVNKQIIYNGTTYEVASGDIVSTDAHLYLNIDYLGKVFGLNCSFNFRTLTVYMTTKAELPIIREMKQEMIRGNLNKLKGNIIVDTTIAQTYPKLHFGMADWSVIATQQAPGSSQTLLNLTLGSIIAGGETTVGLNYNSAIPFSEKQQYYLWRRVAERSRLFKQVMLGKINPMSTSSIYAPVVGVQLTNSSTEYRQSFGSYTVSNTTLPGWVVELYVNNVLVDYTTADATGFYSFKVPLVYGTSQVKYRLYGPFGEEQLRMENINIPFTFLPPKQLEYTVSAGVVEDERDSKFARGNFNYGISRRFTVGGGLEYLSTLSRGKVMPFLTTGLRLGQGLMLAGEYTYGVRTKAILNYRTASDIQVELDYTKYQKGQTAINFSFLEERKAIISVPLRSRSVAVFSRLTVNQVILPYSRYVNSEWLLSGSWRSIGAHISTYYLYSDNSSYIYSNVSLAIRLPFRMLVTPQCQYDFNRSSLISSKLILEKRVFSHGYVNLSYEQNMKSNIRNLGVELKYDFPFAQVSFSARKLDNQINYLQSAKGSAILDREARYYDINGKTSVRRAGIVLIPFIDLDGDGQKDIDEPRAPDLNVHINGGRVEIDRKDTTLMIFDLEPYRSYHLELDPNSFDNIAWKLQKKSLKVVTEPNRFKPVHVPVTVMAEVSGTVYRQDNGITTGQKQIVVNFYKNDSLVARKLTEDEGYFNIMGLSPGKYIVRIDEEQLKRINMSSFPLVREIEIKKNAEGDVVEGIEFTLQTKSK